MRRISIGRWVKDRIRDRNEIRLIGRSCKPNRLNELGR